jgi:hypothetical protein
MQLEATPAEFSKFASAHIGAATQRKQTVESVGYYACDLASLMYQGGSPRAREGRGHEVGL